MYRIGNEELEAVQRVMESKKIFRYGIGGECTRFEERYADYVGTKHCVMTASGTNSLTAALMALEIGPGDEVIVPACTYMATPIAVLAAGAIPVIADIDDTVTLDPKALEATIGPRTKAVIPVHMWGLPCNMDAIMSVARKAGIYVVEDACQGVGGAYEGRMLGSIGDVGTYSFNYYKNMTTGEGGAVVTDNDEWHTRVMSAIDPCRFYWDGREGAERGFTANGARASEFEGAILNEQLNRLPEMISQMREQKKRILAETAEAGLEPIRSNSPDHECGTHAMYRFDSAAAADAFAEAVGGTVAIKTGRHVYTEWDPILEHRGGHHPAMNPYNYPANAECRTEYSKEMCETSLDILARTVFLVTHPDNTTGDVDAMIAKIREAASVAV
ncbi:MAG: DegT/DnrJ/EryC1/StrS family aminotransferase [Spirochaetota bacterium]